MVDLASTLLVHVVVIYVCQYISLLDQTATRRWPTRNQPFHSQTAMVARVENNSNTASFGRIVCFHGSGTAIWKHVPSMRGMWRQGACLCVIVKSIMLMTVFLSAFDVHHIVGCVVNIVRVVWIVW